MSAALIAGVMLGYSGESKCGLQIKVLNFPLLVGTGHL